MITFTVYGSWLHGDERGAYDFGGVHRTPNERLKRFEAQNLRNPTRTFNLRERQVVDAAIRSLCSERDWTIRALNVRSNHVHAVVEIFSTPPKRAAAQMKAKATLRLRRDENRPQDANLVRRRTLETALSPKRNRRRDSIRREPMTRRTQAAKNGRFLPGA